jgi:hypothetical protein
MKLVDAYGLTTNAVMIGVVVFIIAWVWFAWWWIGMAL